MLTNSDTLTRRHVIAALGATAALPTSLLAQSGPYPNRNVDVIVPAGAGGGTDVLARALSDVARKHFSQPLTVVNRPGASGMIGHGEMINAKPDGYKIALVFAEIVIVPHLGLTKLSYEDFTPIAMLNADPAAITVKADSPWKTIEEFLAAAKQKSGQTSVGNSGPGSIWHLAAAAIEDKTNVKFNHVSFGGAAPAVLALLGGHIDAVAVSPGEVAVHVQGGRLRTLAVAADKRVKGFDTTPTFKERSIDVSLSTWRGLAAPKGTPPEVLSTLAVMAKKCSEEQALKDTLDRLSMGWNYLDADGFRAYMKRDNDFFKSLISRLGLKA